jgi:hypothetical protein
MGLPNVNNGPGKRPGRKPGPQLHIPTLLRQYRVIWRAGTAPNEKDRARIAADPPLLTLHQLLVNDPAKFQREMNKLEVEYRSRSDDWHERRRKEKKEQAEKEEREAAARAKDEAGKKVLIPLEPAEEKAEALIEKLLAEWKNRPKNQAV